MHVVHKMHKMVERLMAKVGGHKLQELGWKTGGFEGRSPKSLGSRLPPVWGVITFGVTRVESRIKCIFKYRPT